MIAASVGWDYARWALTCLIGANVGGCAAIVYFYSRRSDIEPGWGKWLPKHVWRVVLGTMLLVISTLIESVYRLGDAPLWFGLPLVLPGNLLILWGLIYMIGYQRNRLSVSNRAPGLKRLDDPPPDAVGLSSTKDDADARNPRRSA